MKTNPNAHYSKPIYSFVHVLRFVRALKSPKFSHARVHPVSPNSLQVYHLDPSSPTRKRQAASIEREYGEEVMARLRLAGRQLSPTENLGR
jgi:hypothetical protein